MSRLPLIGVTACSTQIGLYAYHISGDTHVHAEARDADSVPSISAFPLAPSDILDGLDDILFTGSPFNIEPFYSSSPADASRAAHDSARTTTLLLTHAIVRVGICARQWQWQSVPSDADASNNA